MKKVDIALGLLRIPLDILAASAALLLAYQLRTENIDLLPNVQLLSAPTTLPTLTHYVRTFVLPGIVVFITCNAFAKLYILQIHFGLLREVQRLILVCAIWAIAIMAWYFFVEKELFYSRILLIHSTVFLAVFTSAGRIAIRLIKRSLLRHDIGKIHILSVGNQPLSTIGLQMIAREPRYKYLGHVHSLNDLKKTTKDIDQIIQTDPTPNSETTLALIDYCRSEHIEYTFLPPVFADVPHKLRIERVKSILLIKFMPTALDGWGKVVKRLFDILGSLILIILLLPVFIIVSIAILIDSGWPIVYVSRRIGEHGKTMIPVFKFRSMVQNADALKEKLLTKNERRDGPLFKIKNDPRITKLGKFLRRFDIDELPQLFNVVLGHMSLVGPRPHLPAEVARYKSYERRVFAVKPGITGLAQISGRSDLPFEEEVRLDLQYIEEWSLRRDIKILLYTVAVVLGKGGE
jgi:exopolysaccharide biosynthesis polyprenyl glycosylphosphotransferase